MAYVGNAPAAGIIDGGNVKDGSITNADLAAGVAVANLGYTPVNKAGDTISGAINIGGIPPSAGMVNAVSGNSQIELALSDNINASLYGRPAPGGFVIGTDGGGALRFASNGNTVSDIKMVLDTFGRLTTPYQPHVYAYGSPSLSFSSTWQVVVYNGVMSNIGNCYNGSTGRFTAPVTAIYSFDATAIVSAGSPNAYDYRLALRVNNGSNVCIESYTKASPWPTVRVSKDFYLSAGDYVDVCMYNDNAVGSLHPDSSFTRLSITMLG